MKIFVFVSLLTAAVNVACSQSQIPWVDSTKKILRTQEEDTNKVWTLVNLAGFYEVAHADTGIMYSQQALQLAQKLNFKSGIFYAQGYLAVSLIIAGNYSLGLDYAFKTVALSKEMDASAQGFAASLVSYSYYYLGDYKTSLAYIRKGMISENIKAFQPFERALGWRDYSLVFHKLNEHDSAMYYAQKALAILKNSELANMPNVMGDAYAGKQRYDSALFYYRGGIPGAMKENAQPVLIDCYNNIAAVYRIENRLDSAIWYSKKVLSEQIEKSYPIGLSTATTMLADIYSLENRPDSALKYLKISFAIRDSLFSREKTNAVQTVAFREQEKQKELEVAKVQWRNSVKLYALLGVLFAVMIIAGILFRSNKQKQKAAIRIRQAYDQLKSTQQQLIQREKMASLGELTAGIAHEIQNPLNFVNNFSEVNTEMLTEMKQEMDKGNYMDAREMINDVIANEGKISHHGKRADAIVKGMFEHSRQTDGERQMTGMNALAGEYMKLSYNGFKAKDKEFTAGIRTDFDKSIGNIQVIPQDIGKVLLNVYNNAFYAVNEKAHSSQLAANSYEPLVSVQTILTENKIVIKITDNGNGIPRVIIDKIFQPFFTTKPTGQGTGLGLSLAYDIIKAHGGEITAHSIEGEGTSITISLPA